MASRGDTQPPSSRTRPAAPPQQGANEATGFRILARAPPVSHVQRREEALTTAKNLVEAGRGKRRERPQSGQERQQPPTATLFTHITASANTSVVRSFQRSRNGKDGARQPSEGSNEQQNASLGHAEHISDPFKGQQEGNSLLAETEWPELTPPSRPAARVPATPAAAAVAAEAVVAAEKDRRELVAADGAAISASGKRWRQKNAQGGGASDADAGANARNGRNRITTVLDAARNIGGRPGAAGRGGGGRGGGRGKQQQLHHDAKFPAAAAVEASAAAERARRLRGALGSTQKRRRLTPLKKRILSERERRWTELTASAVASSAECAADAVPGAARSPPVLQPPLPRTFTNTDQSDNDVGPAVATAAAVRQHMGWSGTAAGGLAVTAAAVAATATVCVTGAVTVEELEDDDEYEEILSNLLEMGAVYGKVQEVLVPRPPDPLVGSIFLTFGSAVAAVEECLGATVIMPSTVAAPPGAGTATAAAAAAVAGLNGRVVGGVVITAALRSPAEALAGAGAAATPTTREGIAASTAVTATEVVHSSVRILGLVQPEEVEEDDEYSEVVDNIWEMAGAFGTVSAVTVPRQGSGGGSGVGGSEGGVDGSDGGGGGGGGGGSAGEEVGTVVVTFASKAAAAAAVAGLQGKIFGGSAIEASIVATEAVGASEAAVAPDEVAPAAMASAAAVVAGGSAAATVAAAVFAAEEPLASPAAAEVVVASSRQMVACANPSLETARATATATAAARSGPGSVAGSPAPCKASNGRPMPEKYGAAAALPKLPRSAAGANYVSPPPDEEVDALVAAMLSELFRFQERARHKDPLKAKRQRRLVMGLREVQRGLRSHKIKLVVAAPDIEQAVAPGSLDETVTAVVATARAEDIPVVFALTRRRIGKALGKSVKVSVVGVYSVDGAMEQFRELLKRLPRLEAVADAARAAAAEAAALAAAGTGESETNERGAEGGVEGAAAGAAAAEVM